MKHLYLLFWLLLPSALLAQRLGGVTTQAAAGGGTQPPIDYGYSCFERLSTYQLRADSVLLPLNKSQIPTGILYDRTVGLDYLTAFS